jgi:protein-S-isoprenylcysteine O-methyltransferase Ste14
MVMVLRRAESERRAGVRWFVAGYAGLAGFLALEAVVREGGGTASSLDTSDEDHATTRMILAAYAAAVTASPIVRRLPSPRLPRGAGPTGLAMEAIGLGVRAWSMRTLGRSYSRTLRTEDDQAVIDTGPYHLVRHPGYLGSLLVWTGFALTSRSLPVAAVVGAMLGSAYQRRISAEERLLRSELPTYAAYSDRTKKLIPFVW